MSGCPNCRRRANATKQALPIYRAIGAKLGEANCIMGSGKVYGLQQQDILALEQFALASQKYHQFGDMWSEANVSDNLGVLYRNRYNYSKALEAFSQAITLFADEAKWWINRASVYIRLNDPSNAAQDLETAASLQPENAYLFLRRGELAILQGHHADAITHFAAALERYPRMNVACFGMGLAHLRAGQAAEALAAYGQGLSFTDSPSDLDDALEELEALKGEPNAPAEVESALRLLQEWRKS